MAGSSALGAVKCLILDARYEKVRRGAVLIDISEECATGKRQVTTSPTGSRIATT